MFAGIICWIAEAATPKGAAASRALQIQGQGTLASVERFEKHAAPADQRRHISQEVSTHGLLYLIDASPEGGQHQRGIRAGN